VQTLLSKLRRILFKIVIDLVIASFFSVALTFFLQYTESTQVESLTITTTITIANETTFSLPYEGFVKKGYFDSVATIYVYLSSPYASYWETFNVWMSLDNSSWVSIPFLESNTTDKSQMANLGLISLGNPKLTIYQKNYVPPQTILLPPNVTKENASNLLAKGVIKKQAIPSDTTQWILVFLTVFGALFAVIAVILDYYFSDKDANIGKIQSKKPRKKPKKTEALKKPKMPKSKKTHKQERQK
jgi:hypothetical protein